ncbi:Zn(2)-C6 fungal-type domain-containing protein [Mycena indigotica]|uniref:Zn(2)-C6 fungal-type domain-containing protein n=1 Tax=Mycena indigotica TaxID=2126181 RepID=A0A8H6T685_9AGAR|nr:Zn(2)-C6 fungal-type domain-containing protein [Mycena indigotica]KAF7310180.1 Zn(2)-C6 fungal-type domain-containing protein [Mycena indigotica]
MPSTGTSTHHRSHSSSRAATSDDAPKRARTAQACINCRRRKRKCTPSENPNNATCTRCESQGLVCEFPAPDADEVALALHLQLYPPPLPPVAAGYPRAAPALTYQHTFDMPYAAAAWPHVAYGNSLPYTGPPPAHTRPRYSDGTPYPNLALTPGVAAPFNTQEGYDDSEISYAYGTDAFPPSTRPEYCTPNARY